MIKVIYIIDRDDGDLTGPMRQMLSCLAANPRILLDIRDCRRPGGSRDAFLEGLLDEPNVRLSRHAGSSMSFCCNSALEAGGEADWIQFLQAGTSYDVDQLLQELFAKSRVKFPMAAQPGREAEPYPEAAFVSVGTDSPYLIRFSNGIAGLNLTGIPRNSVRNRIFMTRLRLFVPIEDYALFKEMEEAYRRSAATAVDR